MSPRFPRNAAGELKNEFLWSETRNRNFHECRRKYYFAHYGHWGGWRRDADERTRRCYVLGKMTTLPMWSGQVVHETIQEALGAVRDRWPNRPSLDPEVLRESARRRLRIGWLDSKERRWEGDPKRCVNLFEHYFDLEIPPERIDRVKETVYGSLDRFADLELVRTVLQTDPLDWLAVEDFARFDLGDFRAVVRFDLVLRDGRNIVVLDWKTGRESPSDREQVCTYALAASSMWNVAMEEIRLFLVYLAADRIVEGRITPEEAIEARERIYLACHEMAAMIRDGDVRENEPLPEEAFEKTDDPAVCARCPFQELCHPPDALPVKQADPSG